MAIFAYGRFSSRPQEEGDSTRRQTSLVDAWLARNKLELDLSLGTLFDRGKSAHWGQHREEGTALKLFLDCVESGRVRKGDVLLIENLDRLSREEPVDAIGWIMSLFQKGVVIVTLSPEFRYDRSSLNDYAIHVLTGELQRAFRESSRKSDLGKGSWVGRREKIHDGPISGRCPIWLRLNKQENKFEFVPETAAVVRRMVELALAGHGVSSIAKVFNEEKVPRFRKTTRPWQTSTILKILRSRSLIGEFQPHQMVGKKKRVPVGDPVADYYPPLIKEAQFHRLQQAIDGRKRQRGRHGKRLRNLFTGMVFDARDGLPMHVSEKQKGHGGLRIVSVGAKFGVGGSQYVSIPYEMLERAILRWAVELGLADVLPRENAADVLELIVEKEGQLANLDHRIKLTQERLETSEEPEALLGALESLAKKRKKAAGDLEDLKRRVTTNETESLERIRELLEKIRDASEEEQYDYRLRLRVHLRRMVNSIYVLPLIVGGVRIAVIDVLLTNGERRWLVAKPVADVYLPEELEGLDIREYSKWPKKLRRIHWTC